MPMITERALRRLCPGKWISEALRPYGSGSLQARRTTAGLRFYYRYGSEQKRIPLIDQRKRALDLADARDQARQLARQNRSGLTADLGSLLMNYCDLLEANRRANAKATRALLCRHVERVAIEIWRKPASDIRPDDILQLLEPLIEADKVPTAIQLRSALRAAFALARSAHLDAQAKNLRPFHITANPVADIRVIHNPSPQPRRVLSIEELRALWRRLEATQGTNAAILRFYLLTGSQRVTQLLRATRDDLTPEGLRLYDPKGRPNRPREHLIALITPARAELNRLQGNGPYLFSLDDGHHPVTRATLHRHIAQIARSMVIDGQSSATFSFADLRRTVETRLAAEGISGDVRAQLQSHGLGGIQARHYDCHDYLNEKRQALHCLYGLMASPPIDPTNVIHLRTARPPTQTAP